MTATGDPRSDAQALLANLRAWGVEEVLVPMPDGTYATLPWDQTIGRVQAASARHREKLQMQRAWTCRPTGWSCT